MNLQDLINRVRVYTRDFTGSIYRETDIDIFLREAFDRFSVIPEFKNVAYPATKTNDILIIPSKYQYLLSMYASSRCFFQDEQDYRAGSLMNEFETKLEELKSLIESGDIVITDLDGDTVVPILVDDYVKDVYFDAIIPDDEVIL